MSGKQINYSRSFVHHGVNLEFDVEKNLTADCPFCGKEWHFRVNQYTGQWRCLRCEAKGNLYSFLLQLWQKALSETNNNQRQALMADRGFCYQTVKEAGLAFDSRTDNWLLPIWVVKDNGTRALVDLKTWNRSEKKPLLKSTPNCAQHLYNSESLANCEDPSLPTLICEGHWDTLAMLDCGWRGSVVGAPGANTFKQPWADLFSGREVRLLYDRDDPGRNGMRMVVNMLCSSITPPKTISCLAWPEDTASGIKDLRDILKSDGRKQLLTFTEENLVEAIPDDLKIIRNSWTDVLKDFESLYHVDQTFKDATTIVGATVLAARVPGDPLWVFLVGPPSTSKTIIVESFGFDREHCEMISKITATQLVSGWKLPGSDEDVSVFPLLRNRTMLIPDYTTIIGMPASAQEDLYGMLREAYQGKVRIRYGNGKIVDVEDVYFSIVAAVTDVIRKNNRADLGERFLKIEVIGPEYDHMAVTMTAMDGVVKDATRVRRLHALGESIKTYIQSIHPDLRNLPLVPENYRRKIASLSLIVGYLRAIVHKDVDDLEIRPRQEGGGRVAKQLIKLAICICLLLKKSQVDAEVFRLIEKAAVDTIWGYGMELCRLISRFPHGLTTDDIAIKLQLPKTTVQRLVGDLQQLRVITRIKAGHSGPGRDSHLWMFTEKFGAIWQQSGLTHDSKSNTPVQQLRKQKVKVFNV